MKAFKGFLFMQVLYLLFSMGEAGREAIFFETWEGSKWRVEDRFHGSSSDVVGMDIATCCMQLWRGVGAHGVFISAQSSYVAIRRRYLGFFWCTDEKRQG